MFEVSEECWGEKQGTDGSREYEEESRGGRMGVPVPPGIRKSLAGKVSMKNRSEGDKSCGKRVTGRGASRCKEPVAGTWLLCLRKRQKDTIAEQEKQGKSGRRRHQRNKGRW